MASTPKFYDRVMESSTTTGTGTYTLAGAITGFQTFAVVGDGKSAYYCAQDVDSSGNPSGGWEVGIGTYTLSGTTFSRDSVLASTNSNAAVSWAAGTRRIFVVVPAGMTAAPLLMPGLPVVGAKFVRATGQNLPTGNNDLYTVPTGKRALIPSGAAFNASAGSITYNIQFKRSGTYYRLNANAAIGAGIGGQFTSACCLLDAGDIHSVFTQTTAGLVVWADVLEFDATSPLVGAFLTTLTTGDNTLYTCPVGKAARLFPPNADFGAQISGAAVAIVGDNGGSRTYYVNYVSSGGSPSSANKVSVSSSIGAAQRTVLGSVATLEAGDYVSVNVSTGAAGQIVHVIALEFPA